MSNEERSKAGGPADRLGTLREWLGRLRGALRPARRDADLEEELRFHVEAAAEDARRRGLGAADARRDARLTAGGTPQALEALRDQRGLPWLDDLGRDLRHGLRALRHTPVFTGVVVLTLALGIGANVAIFTVVNAVLLRPLPYPEPDRIVEVRHHAPGLNMPEMQNAPGLIERYRRHSRTAGRMAGYDIRAINVAGGGSPERVRAVAVSAGLFEVLATRPTLGRPFRDSDAQPGGPRAIILTHGFWHARFGADPDVVGRTLRLDGRAAEVVGVMPRDFVFPDPATRLLVPLALDEDGRMGSFGTVALARLAPGVTLDAARTEIDQLQQRIPEWFPDLTPDTLAGFGWSTTVEPLRDRVVASVARTLWILFGTAGLVLLAAAANVANLFLVRAESRQREIAVRSALGASRARIARTFLAESLVLAAIGGWTGLLLASAGTRLLAAYGPAGLPRLHEVGLDARVVAFAAALSVVVAVLLGVLPASRIARRPFAALVREDGRGITTGRRGHRVRQALIVAQVAMAIVLLVGSGLMLRSVARLYAVDPGFRVEGVICAGVSLGPQADRTRAVAFYHDVLDQMARMPGVSAAGAASSLPVGGTGQSGSGFTIRSRPTLHTRIQPFTMYSGVTAGYFDALGVPLLEGRAPARTDAGQGRPVAWVSRTFARQFLDDRAIGEWININIKDTWREIVGVVGDVRIFGLREQVRPMVYLPLSDAAVGIDVMHAVVRTTGSPAALAPALRAAVDRVDASVPLTTVRTMEDIVSASVAEASFTMTLLAIAAGVTLVLGVVGLYGVVSYIVRQRTVEIGIRLALGANPGSVRAMVLRQGVTVAMAGVLVGLAAAAASTRFMASLLFEVSARDPATFAAVALIITAVSALATYLPARRAAGIDPLQALRDQG